MIVKICENCGIEFKVKESRFNARFCSNQCYRNYKKDNGIVASKCKNCGKTFESKKSSNRIFCSQECYMEYYKKNNIPRRTKHLVMVKCAQCGKIEYVIHSRAKTYKCCSKKCLGEYSHIKANERNHKCECPICGNIFYLDNYSFYRAKYHCCSVACCNKLRKKIFRGENNHQYGLRGDKNPCFKGSIIKKKNNLLHEEMIYVGCWYKRANEHGRIPLHRYIVEKNHSYYGDENFDHIEEWFYIKRGLEVHHIDCNHSNNSMDNLVVLSESMHRKIHANIRKQPRDTKSGRFISNNSTIK